MSCTSNSQQRKCCFFGFCSECNTACKCPMERPNVSLQYKKSFSMTLAKMSVPVHAVPKRTMSARVMCLAKLLRFSCQVFREADGMCLW